MEAALQSDFSTLDGFLQKLMEAVEAAHSMDASKRLAEDLLRHYHAHGDLEMRLVSSEHADEVIEKLQTHNIPLMHSKNSNGDSILILPPDQKYGYDYGSLIDEVFMHYPEYYKQLEKRTWSHLADVDEERGVIKFHFTNTVDAEIFKNKIFADGNGIVTTDLISEDGSVTVVCRESDFLVNGKRKDALSALIDTEVSLDPDHQAFARRFAVWHDSRQVDDCMRFMNEGTSFVIHNGAEKQSDYLSFDQNKLTYYSYSNELGKFVGREIPADTKDQDAMRKLFEYHVSHIHNEYVSTIEEFERDYEAHSDTFIRDRYTEKQKELYTDVILPAMSFIRNNRSEHTSDSELFDQVMESDFFQKAIKEHGLEDIRPDFSEDFLKSLRDDFARQEQELTKDLQELIVRAKEDNARAAEQLKSRADTFYKSLEESGISQISGRPVRAFTLDQIQRELMHKMSRQETKLRDACGQSLGSLPGCEPSQLLRAFHVKGIPIAHEQQAKLLLEKGTLTEAEKSQLQMIADDTLFDFLAAHNPQIKPYLQDYYITRGKLRDVSDLLDGHDDLMRTLEQEQESNRELLGQQQRLIKDANKRVSMIDSLIEGERERADMIAELDEKAHAYANSIKLRNPGIQTSGLLRQVTDFLNKNGCKVRHTDISGQSFTEFQKEVFHSIDQQEYANETLEERV